MIIYNSYGVFIIILFIYLGFFSCIGTYRDDCMLDKWVQIYDNYVIILDYKSNRLEIISDKDSVISMYISRGSLICSNKVLATNVMRFIGFVYINDTNLFIDVLKYGGSIESVQIQGSPKKMYKGYFEGVCKCYM